MVLGLPFYGYAWRLVDANRNGLYASANGPALASDSTLGYTEIKKFIADNQNVGKTVFNGTVVTDNCYAGTTWIGYDDEQSISRKNVGKTVFNGTVVTDYCYAGTTWIGYDDEQSISRKVSYAKNRGLLGYFGWHAGADSDMILSGKGLGEHKIEIQEMTAGVWDMENI
ncbi:hypothetical protein TIFTF001_037373 [Ficus carica]|uniref:GH18 domain-containing protein n=1 Tax=Ficus carica TaxID=3494 RepID=A0AA88E564_FICCA|nr:hypothetical protein TIFTF001_037371 [Ficus carica]GMN68317.1 hypothetical protein TIFTF001_037373 [Ficus carica]